MRDKELLAKMDERVYSTIERLTRSKKSATAGSIQQDNWDRGLQATKGQVDHSLRRLKKAGRIKLGSQYARGWVVIEKAVAVAGTVAESQPQPTTISEVLGLDHSVEG